MRCIYCDGYVPLAEPRTAETWCTDCGARFYEVHDYGFFDYTAEVYIPVKDDDD